MANHASSAREAPRVHFIKRVVDSEPVRFEGDASGAVTGSRMTEILRETLPERDRFRFVAFRWNVTAPGRSFVAQTQGTVDKTTGEMVQLGTFVAGWRAGSSVMERGQLIDPGTLTFEGDVVVLATSTSR
jgi:hypothetical protein